MNAKAWLIFLTALVQSTVCLSLDVTLTVLHTNDVHSRFLQMDKFGGTCSVDKARKNECYGGFARLHHKVGEIRESHKNVLYLSGGDYYQGTVWYTVYKWRVVAEFVNALNHTAMALGNHEFDDNIAGIVPFLESATFPIISCNIDDSSEPTIQGKYKKSIVVEIEGGRKVGIIGYTTEETMAVSTPGKLKFLDVVSSVREEAERLDKLGVQISIALGHAGYDIDQKIAEQVPLIDAVVGGHTNTFLYHGASPDIEKHKGDYPTVVTQPSGRKVPVVQAYAFGKYLGYLNLTINESGEVIGWNGNPILLDGSVPQDPTLLQELEEWGKNLTLLTQTQIGITKVLLEGSASVCRLKECNLGNLVADAMVYASLKFSGNDHWSDVTMAVVNAGYIRSSIDERARNGSVTMDDILTVQPFQNTMDLIEIKGEYLRQAFEFGVQDYNPDAKPKGKFLQVSGIKVVYDVSKPNGARVQKIEVLCKDCRVPSYKLLDDSTVYKLAVPNYIANGGDGFSVIKNNILARHLSEILDSDILLEYIKAKSPIVQAVEGRITFVNGSCTSPNSEFLSMLNIFL